VASIRYRLNGWELRYRDPTGKQRTDRFASGSTRRPPPELVARRAEVEAQLRGGHYIGRDQLKVTFGVYFERWWQARRVSATRAHTDRQRADKHVLPTWGGWPIGAIRPSDIDDWITGLSTTLGPESVRACYALLRGPLRRAVRDRIITDPCIGITLPKLPDISKTFDDVLSADELDRLVAALRDTSTGYTNLRTNHRYQALVFLGGWLGPRWNEAIGLRHCDLNPDRLEITFGRQVINQNGSHTFAETGSKTGDWRTIPVPSPVMDVITAHIAEHCPHPRREDLIFTNNRGGHILRGNFTRDTLRPALTRAGLAGRHVTWLTLRHTAASLMFDAGLTLFEVQHRLGHKSPTLTAKIYTHVMRERFDEGRGRLETYMNTKRHNPFTTPPTTAITTQPANHEPHPSA
jgi:integrase